MNCDRLAPWYRWVERAVFGRTLDRARVAMLPSVPAPRRALVLGDGDGRFLEALLKGNPQVRADYIDLSQGMLRQAQSRVGTQRVTYRRGDVFTTAFDRNAYDLVTTHFLLDCLDAEGIARLAQQVQHALQPGAPWVVTEFRVPQGMLATPTRVLIRVMYAFFRLVAGLRVHHLTDHHPILRAAGFQLAGHRLSLGGLLSSELWAKAPSPDIRSDDS